MSASASSARAPFGALLLSLLLSASLVAFGQTSSIERETSAPAEEGQPETHAALVAGPGVALINEFRFRGNPGAFLDSSFDEFIEIYNNSDTPLVILATDASPGWAVVASNNPSAPLFVIPNGTVIRARGFFLGVNNSSGGYSLSNQGGTGRAAGDATWTVNIPDGAGLALFSTAEPANFIEANRIDAVGFAGVANTMFREGSGLTPSGGIAQNGPDFGGDQGGVAFEQFAFVRRMESGVAQDTNDNEADFHFIAVRPFSLQDAAANWRRPILGSPGPQNLASPPVRNDQFLITLIDPNAAPSQTPNRNRDMTAGNPLFAAQGTLSIRRTFTNQSGQNVTRLRFRVIDITTLNSPNAYFPDAQADLRLLTSSDVTATLSGGGSVLVRGVTIETPPAQSFGGGLNTSVAAGVVTTAAPIPPGGSINLNFTLGVQQTGRFRFFVNIEAETAPVAPTAPAPVRRSR